MKETQILAGIETLSQTFEEMKALLAWHKLKQFESSQESLSNLMVYDNSLDELSDKYSRFCFLASKIRAANDNADSAEKSRKFLKKRLTTIELKAYYLGSPVNIY